MKLPALPVHDPLATMNFERLGASVEPLEVTSLPGSPRDGQVIDYVADATAGVVWRLRYRAASASAYKWEFVGGSPLLARVNTAENCTNSTYVNLATPGPSLTVPLAGEYTVRFGAQIEAIQSTGYRGRASADGTDAGGVVASGGGSTAITYGASPAGEISLVRTANQATSLVYRSDNALSVTMSNRWLEMTPIRVG